MGMLPGIAKMKDQIAAANLDDRMIKRQRAIISSMTREERRNPDVLKASRKKRIAAGSGTKVEDVNRLLKQHRQMADMMKAMGGNKRGADGQDGADVRARRRRHARHGGRSRRRKRSRRCRSRWAASCRACRRCRRIAACAAAGRLQSAENAGGHAELPGLGGGKLPGLGGLNPFGKKK